MAVKNIMDYDTVALDEKNNAIVIIDQTKLPYSTEILSIKLKKRYGTPFICFR